MKDVTADPFALSVSFDKVTNWKQQKMAKQESK